MDNNKRGCLAEYRFAVECLKRGYEISMPLLDSSIYDCLVDVDGKIYKIQIKSTIKTPYKASQSTVHIPIQNNKTLYTKDNVDFFAIWVEYFDGFFIIKNSGNVQSIRLSKVGKYSKYFNNFAFE